MDCAVVAFFLFLFESSRYYFAHGYAPGSKIWRRDHESFIPLVNVFAFETNLYQQEFSDEIRELENHNFQGESVRLGYFQDNNMVNFHDNDTKVSGAFGEIWNILADYSNFTLVVRKSNIGFGTNPYNGLTGMIRRREIDVVPRVAFCDPFPSIMNFTMSIWEDRYRFYIRPAWSTDTNWMFNMFTSKVWWAILVLLFVLSAVGNALHTITNKVLGKKTFHYNFHDFLFHTFATLCSQSSASNNLGNRHKIYRLTKTVFAWLILLVLSSNLISWLSNRKFQAPFTDLPSLLNRTKYNLVLHDGSMVYIPFRNKLRNLTGESWGSPRDPGGEFQDRLNLVNSTAELYEIICSANGKYSIFESEDTYRAAGRLFCNLVPAGLPYITTSIAFGVIGEFKYHRTFDVGILKLKQFGLISGMKERWIKSFTVESSATNSLNPVNFEQVSMLFAILCFGMISSVVIFILETVVFVYGSRFRRSFTGHMRAWK